MLPLTTCMTEGEGYGMEFYRPTWAEIDLDKFTTNIHHLQTHLGLDKKILAVVKANAYGHGAIPMAAAAIEAGAAYLGVSSIDEGVELREGGISAPILVLGYSSPAYAQDIVGYGLTQTVFTEDILQALSDAAIQLKKTAKIHIKVDTGMGRIGIRDLDHAYRFIRRAFAVSGLDVEGVFTHLATAEDPNYEYAHEQYQKWMQLCQQLSSSGVHIPYQHIANSGAGLQHPYMHSSLVRIGISLYGVYPATHLQSIVPLQQVMRLSSQIVYLQTHSSGSKISYGSRYTTQEGERIATVPIGYADGYSRLLSGKGHVLVRGVRVPIVGAICMDQLMVNVSSVPDVAVGDEVVLYGQQASEFVSVDEIADHIGTISYEVLCSLGRRVPRLYMEKGHVKEIRKW
ncbi:MAG: alanine racemase [Bacilli bacterium]|nr:alanine racemase [Bacilli bacterium]